MSQPGMGAREMHGIELSDTPGRIQNLPNDPVGSKPIDYMTDREIAEETLFWLRETGRALAEIQSQGLGGIMKAMMTGGKK